MQTEAHTLLDLPTGPLAPRTASPVPDRRLPPELALLQVLARLRLAPPGRREALVRVLLGLADPPSDEDRPALRSWLGSLAPAALAAEGVEEGVPCLPDPLLAQQEEADQLHRLAERLQGQTRRQRRLLEQELLLRSSLPEDWQFHRAKWGYLELQEERTGRLLAPAEAARRARVGGVLFHPDQLRPSPLRRWYSIKRALDMLDAGAWLSLLDHLLAGRPVDLVLAVGLWTHLRPWLSFLLGGSGIPFVELYSGSLPDMPPAAAQCSGLLVLHSDDVLDARLEPWCRQAGAAGWCLLVVRQQAVDEAAYLNRVAAGRQSMEWVRRQLVSGAGDERVLPLRDFVRQVERSYILDVLGLHNGIKTRACERLQISRQTLYSKLGGGEVEA